MSRRVLSQHIRGILTMAVVMAAAPVVIGAPVIAKPITELAELVAVTNALDALPPPRNTAWGIDTRARQVVLTISDATPQAATYRLLRLAWRWGAFVRIKRISRPLTEQLLDGDTMTDGKIDCSVGFNVTGNGRPYVITAGHCTQGRPYWQDVGPTTASSFPGADFGLIADDEASPESAVNLYNGEIQPITSVGDATVGEQVCASGRTTKVTCGQVTAVNQTVNYGDGNVVHGLIETTVHTDHGDSGGPLFDGSTGLGMVSGGDGHTDYFQPLAPVLASYHLTLG